MPISSPVLSRSARKSISGNCACFDDRTRVLHPPRQVFHRLADLFGNRNIRESRSIGDPQSPETDVRHPFDRHRLHLRIVPVWPGDDPVEQGQILDRAGHRADACDTMRTAARQPLRIGKRAMKRNPVFGRLQSEHAAAMPGQASKRRHVGADLERRHPGGQLPPRPRRWIRPTCARRSMDCWCGRTADCRSDGR